ncbi:uncharacterized protein LOC128738262 [Sabethes cyaneus]|uniref:uncharacterized protein LOC128738262 n=1 Tax=Sabethes cyaneus TaxID=53552 RepID=UPI00237E3C9E|nr:uncharacterized protein LOC128738262 [Sabethes cyaneus]
MMHPVTLAGFIVILFYLRQWNLVKAETFRRSNDGMIYFPESHEADTRFGGNQSNHSENVSCNSESSGTNKASRKGVYVYDADAQEWTVSILIIPPQRQNCPSASSVPQTSNTSQDKTLRVYNADTQQWGAAKIQDPTISSFPQSSFPETTTMKMSEEKSQSEQSEVGTSRKNPAKSFISYNSQTNRWDVTTL